MANDGINSGTSSYTKLSTWAHEDTNLGTQGSNTGKRKHQYIMEHEDSNVDIRRQQLRNIMEHKDTNFGKRRHQLKDIMAHKESNMGTLRQRLSHIMAHEGTNSGTRKHQLKHIMAHRHQRGNKDTNSGKRR
ncbi:hypothetical protein Fot_37567 [Forsythia ovata]|uniref:Uncharacterized protein n=1 Tax=Forsythia ovata TaxID=205694 RepID=A0ABD1RZD3_9LAMI